MTTINYRQKSSDEFWTDESGVQIPYNRTTPLERAKEIKIEQLYRKSIKINEALVAFKSDIEAIVADMIDMARKANDVKLNGKGNFTFFNFDRSLKIEVNISELIRFDDLTLEAAKEVLLGVVRKNVTGDEFILSLVEDAFQTSRGRLDTRKILGLKKHTQRIKTKDIREEWEKAMSLIDQSISRPDSKTYYRVWAKDLSGQYQSVELNFSSI
ncbi:MAG: DUF3164 family protein [Chitinophagales bacterium]|nr:DUF3164 family protein [Chitinophagales bacterium]